MPSRFILKQSRHYFPGNAHPAVKLPSLDFLCLTRILAVAECNNRVLKTLVRGNSPISDPDPPLWGSAVLQVCPHPEGRGHPSRAGGRGKGRDLEAANLETSSELPDMEVLICPCFSMPWPAAVPGKGGLPGSLHGQETGKCQHRAYLCLREHISFGSNSQMLHSSQTMALLLLSLEQGGCILTLPCHWLLSTGRVAAFSLLT